MDIGKYMNWVLVISFILFLGIMGIAFWFSQCWAEAELAGDIHKCRFQIIDQRWVKEAVQAPVTVWLEPLEPEEKWRDLDSLFAACSLVESNNNSQPVGDKGKSVGIVQIQQKTVDDVNSIMGKRRYSYEDRWCPKKSREIFESYLVYYGEKYRRQTGKTPTIEIYARIWNGGPDGWQKSKTKQYWAKVKATFANVAFKYD